MIQEHHDLLRLNLSPRIGRATLFRLRDHFGSFSAAARASEKQWQAAGVAARYRQTLVAEDAPVVINAQKKIAALGIRMVTFWDSEYPPLLQTIYDPPALLYVRGTLPTNDSFAIVGSRRATESGLTFTSELAAQLAAHEICVVSGMARGVDSAAHAGALRARGRTIAVLGCGVDRIYPSENTRLYCEILEENAIISEYPPGTLPATHHFPARNRIISGLCRGVLVVEAAEGSGSLITADFALEQGRELFATPGAVTHPNSLGPHQLLKEGAQLVTSADDILQELWPDSPAVRQPEAAATPPPEETVSPRQGPPESVQSVPVHLDPPSARVYALLSATPLHHDDIARKCALTPMELSAILLDLELRGHVRQLPGGHYVRSTQ